MYLAPGAVADRSSPAIPAAREPRAAGRPVSGERAIERIAETYGVPRDVVRREFWDAWCSLTSDARILDYVVVLAERRVVAILRGKRPPGEH
ncbi:MAG: DUF3562 domain-containing protein [Cupriavidus sp.]|nr:DUF3562 domain-containing protein [Cupriavidus sp.]